MTDRQTDRQGLSHYPNNFDCVGMIGEYKFKNIQYKDRFSRFCRNSYTTRVQIIAFSYFCRVL